jgi:hypothetical protein
MSVTPLHKPPALTPAQQRVEAIVKAASELGMGGFALARLRSAAAVHIEQLTEALRPFAEFSEKAEQFVAARAADGGSAIMPSSDFRLSDFKRAKAAFDGRPLTERVTKS